MNDQHNKTRKVSAVINTYEDVQESAAFIRARTKHRPQIAIVCGTGLGGLVNMMENKTSISYADIPHFPQSTAPDHAGKLVFGTLSGRECVCMQGRAHLYEGYTPWKVGFPIKVLKAMNVKILLLTNASGALNRSYDCGDLVIIKDHINFPGLAGVNPLMGLHDERYGSYRFLALSNAYDKNLRLLAWEAVKQLGYDFVHEGVYGIQTGPCYETVAEARMFQLLGADVMGMSTVTEVLTARHVGMRCFALSVATNQIVMEYDSQELADENEIIANGKKRSIDCQNLISKMVSLISLEDEALEEIKESNGTH